MAREVGNHRDYRSQRKVNVDSSRPFDFSSNLDRNRCKLTIDTIGSDSADRIVAACLIEAETDGRPNFKLSLKTAQAITSIIKSGSTLHEL